MSKIQSKLTATGRWNHLTTKYDNMVPMYVTACTHGTDLIRLSMDNLVFIKLFLYVTGNFTIQNDTKAILWSYDLKIELNFQHGCRFEIIWRNANSRYFARIHERARSRHGSQSTPEFPRLSTDRWIRSVHRKCMHKSWLWRIVFPRWVIWNEKENEIWDKENPKMSEV